MFGFLNRLYFKKKLHNIKSLGKNVHVHESTEIYAPELLEIANDVHIQQGCKLFADGEESILEKVQFLLMMYK